jgi:asparagine synthase (glutamine-hydrolysing)
MTDALNELCIVFNGEIYNYLELRGELEGLGHKFFTRSDTEIILEAYREWGVECVKRLNGMFAFGLYDMRDSTIFLARDRVGKKPLFYSFIGARLKFTSELKALMVDPDFPRRLDMGSLNYYLALGHVPANRCILKDTAKLPPAHILIYSVTKGSLKISRYWELPEPTTSSSDEDLLEELKNLLMDSVRLRMIADVPVGILLSGGIDSSLVTAMAALSSSSPVKTFTVSFPGYGIYDEAPHAHIVAKHFGTEHIDIIAEPTNVELLPLMASQFDEPMADSSMIPTYIASREIRKYAKVALGGDGGDELFAGYNYYSSLQQLECIRDHIPRILRRLLGIAAASFLPPGSMGRLRLIGFAGNLNSTVAHVGMYFDFPMRCRLLSKSFNGRLLDRAPEEYKTSLCIPHLSVLQQATRVDFKTTLADDFLVKVDRASMLASLEIRAPWLDHRLVDFAFGRVPDRLRATKTERKILPRRLAARMLPQEFDLSRKKGFSMPLDAWFKGAWGGFVRSVLEDADTTLFSRKAIQRLLSAQKRGYDNTARIYALAIFELWRRHYHIIV